MVHTLGWQVRVVVICGCSDGYMRVEVMTDDYMWMVVKTSDVDMGWVVTTPEGSVCGMKECRNVGMKE